MSARPRIGFDVTALLAGDTGVARYVRELGCALERRNVELIRFAIGRGNHSDALPGNTRRVRMPLRLVHLSWSIAGMPSGEHLARGCDVVHTPDLVPPPTRRPLVLTVHDLVALEHPDMHPPRAEAAQRSQLAAARDRAAVVLSVSEATAAALRDRGVDAARIVVAPNGLTMLPSPDRSIVPSVPYLLAVGSLTPRKGLDTLIAAFARAALPESIGLVLAGPHGWEASTVFAAIERHDPAGRITCTGRVTDAQLAALYEGCVAVCVPSVAEGFGLPVLEAAAAGAAVVASDLPVFRELAGSIALYAPVGDEQAWADALERIVADDELRTAAVAKGRVVAAEHTWDRAAEITLAAYERAQQEA
ncbi:MAG: glycosyl transferase group 1 [Actinomycetia bacterium]|nr:glycosyl transferase group 1 [Actinomycetes bacterium]